VPPPNTIYGQGNLSVPASATLQFSDEGAALAKMAKDLLNKDVLTLNLDGATATDGICSALGYLMHIDAVQVKFPNSASKPPLGPVKLTGMSGLPDVKVQSYQIPGIIPDGTDGCATLCGAKVEITATVNNPSTFGLQVGTMNGRIQNSAGAVLGALQATGLSLKPGSNTVALSGKLSPAAGDIGAAADFFSTYLQNTAQATTVVGINAGASPVKWLQNVISGMELKTSFPGAGDDFSVLADIQVEALSMNFPDTGPTLAGTVQAEMQLPKGVDLSIIKDVTKSGMAFGLVDADTGVTVGKITAAATVKYNAGKLSASFDATPMQVISESGFSKLIKDLLLSKSKNVRLVGTASPSTLTNMGLFELQGVPFQSAATLMGFNSFEDPAS